MAQSPWQDLDSSEIYGLRLDSPSLCSRPPAMTAQALLSARGFDASLIASPVNEGLVTLTAEKMRAGGKLIAVAKARITH